MAAIRFVICFAAVFIQAAYSTPINSIGLPISYQPNAYRNNLPNSIVERPGCGSRFPVESIGSFTSSAPLSLTIRSENSFEGLVDVRGRLPFTGAVALDGLVPSAGEGVVSYGISESIAIAEVPVAAVASPFYGPDLAAYGPGVAGFGRRGCNCGY